MVAIGENNSVWFPIPKDVWDKLAPFAKTLGVDISVLIVQAVIEHLNDCYQHLTDEQKLDFLKFTEGND